MTFQPTARRPLHLHPASGGSTPLPLRRDSSHPNNPYTAGLPSKLQHEYRQDEDEAGEEGEGEGDSVNLSADSSGNSDTASLHAERDDGSGYGSIAVGALKSDPTTEQGVSNDDRPNIAQKPTWAFPARPSSQHNQSYDSDSNVASPEMTSTHEDNFTATDQQATSSYLKRGWNASGSASLARAAVASEIPGYCLWTGHHVEDVLSVQAIKQGYSTKSNLVETNTARPTLWPHLKNKVGLQNLSTLFGSLLEGRQAVGKVTASSTFKPPPRVTLTDQKREAWLKDLANSAVPLRRQSRTIPHGVRGKVLLDQCLIKRIPLSRAVWLAKCVGINELRAFRRKGMTSGTMQENELKWIEQWTILVETFVDEHVDTAERADWRKDVVYALRFSSRLFSEGLLDTEHYFGWLVQKMSSGSIDQLPIALLLIQIHQASIISSAKFSQLMATNCMLRFHELSTMPGREMLAPLSSRLEKLLQGLLISVPDCFVLTSTWPKVATSLDSIGNTKQSVGGYGNHSHSTSLAALKQKVASRNNRIHRLTSDDDVACVESTKFALIQSLDSFEAQVDLATLSKLYRSMLPDIVQLTIIIMKWAASIHRVAIHRIYLACRLVGRWIDHLELEPASLLGAMPQLRECPSICPLNFSRLIAELVRSRHFNVASYLRSLLSMGGLTKNNSIDRHVLTNLPMQNLPSNLGSLRRNLLGSCTRVQGQVHRDLVGDLKVGISKFIQGRFGRDDMAPQIPFSCEGFSLLNTHERFELSSWLLMGLEALLSQPPRHQLPALRLGQVQSVLDLIEAMDDYSKLHKVVLSLVTRTDMEGLLLVATLLEIRVLTFAALNLAKQLWSCLCNQYRVLRTAASPHKDVCQSLLRTVRCSENPLTASDHLNRELSFCEAGQSVAACTPLSDGQCEAVQEFGGDLDRILAAGCNMEASQLTAAFDILMSRIHKETDSSLSQLNTIKSTLVTLRLANETTFAQCVASWFDAHLIGLDESAISLVISTLLCTDCMSMVGFVANINALTGSGNYCTAAFIGLRFFFPTDSDIVCNPHEPQVVSSQDPWVKLVWRKQFCQGQLQTLLRWTGLCMQSNCMRPDFESPVHMGMPILLQNVAFIQALRTAMLSYPDQFFHAFDGMMKQSGTSSQKLQSLVATLAGPAAFSTEGPMSTMTEGLLLRKDETIRHLFVSTDEFNLPFNQLALRFVTHAWDNDEMEIARVSNICFECVQLASDRNNEIWRRLVTKIGLEACRQMRLRCENQLLFSPSGPEAFVEAFQNSWSIKPTACTTLIEVTKSSILREGDVSIGHKIVQHLGFAVHAFATGRPADSKCFYEWIHALLTVVLLHYRSSVLPAIVSNLLLAICQLLTDEQASMELVELAFETALYLAPHITHSHVQLIRGKLGSKATNPRLRFLLGTSTENDAMFYLSSDVSHNPTSPAQGSTTFSSNAAAFPLRKWELLPYSTSNSGPNDTALSLHLFDARKGRGASHRRD